MKKYFFVAVFAVSFLALTGCGHRNNVGSISDLVGLQNEISALTEQILSGTVSPEDAETTLRQLQAKYTQLTEQELKDSFASVEKTINDQKKIGSLPAWAQQQGLTLPVGMKLDAALSKQTRVNGTGYDSLYLVYQGDYDHALQEAARIASGAHLSISQELQQAQNLLSGGVQISGLDTQSLAKGVIYTNHNLTDTKINYLISVTVDGDGNLTIEATNYQQMNQK